MMAPRDLVLQLSCPVIGMPKYSELAPLQENGERIILASNGTFVEVRRMWARFIAQVGPRLATTVPFGEVSETVEYNAGKIPRALLAEFVGWAQKDSHVEIGAVITWDHRTGEYALRRSTSNHSTSDSLDYTIAELADTEHVVVDCHSHSFNPAFFSSTDDEDDRHAVKYAFVVGNCATSNPSLASRLCVRGAFKKLNWKL